MAAIAVFMMMAVACAPVFAVIAEDKGTDAAAGKVISGSDIQIFKEDSADFSNLVYFGADPGNADYAQIATSGYWVHKTLGTFLRVGDVPGYVPDSATYGFPMIQFTYGYSDASVNNIGISYEVRYGTTVVTSVDTAKVAGTAHIGNDKQINDGAAGYVKHEGVKTISLTQAEGLDDRLWIAPAMQVGDFTLTAKLTQGITTQTVTKTVNAGPAVTVSGKVMDANGNPISGATVAATASGSIVPATSFTTLADGSYSFNVKKGTEVSLTTTATGYTFSGNDSTFSFGTVSSSVSHDFKANEKTGTITVQSANGNPAAGITLTLTWYSQKAGTTAGKYNIANLGTISASTSDANGKSYFTYTDQTPATGMSFFLVVTGNNTSPYTFDVATIATGDDQKDGVTTQLGSKTGSANATNGTATIKAVEKTGTITVQSANGNPAAGIAPTLTWYSQKAGTTAGKYNIANLGTISASTSDANGKSYFTYTDQTPATGMSFFLVVTGVGASIYTFDVATIATGDDQKDGVTTQLGSKTGSANATNGTATIKAVEKTYKISGNVEGASVGTSVSYNDGADKTVTTVAGGAYSFFVKENAVVTIKAIPGYTPVADYALGTITKDIVANFTKTVAPVATGTVNYVVKGLAAGDIATFSFTLNGVKMTDSVNVVGTDATLSLKLKVTDSVTDVSAKVDGKNISAFNGYVANASMPDVTYTMITQDTDPTAKNVPFTVSYTYGNGVTGTLTTDANGIGKLTLPANIDVVRDVTFSSGIYKIEAKLVTGDLYVGTVYTLDVSRAYADPVGKYTVSVDHVSTYAQSNPAVLPDQIGGGVALMNVGDKVSLYAPEYNGYTFKCWMLNGTSIGTDRTIDFTLTQKVLDASDKTATEDVTLQAVYSATPVFAPSAGIDNMTLIIGIIAVVIALLAVVYTVISLKKE